MKTKCLECQSVFDEKYEIEGDDTRHCPICHSEAIVSMIDGYEAHDVYEDFLDKQKCKQLINLLIDNGIRDLITHQLEVYNAR